MPDAPTNEYLVAQPEKPSSISPLIILIILVILGVIVYFVRNSSFARNSSFLSSKLGSISQPQNINDGVTKKTSPLFNPQSATINGKITKIEGRNLTIVDNKNQTDTFQANDNLVVYKQKNGNTPASSSANIKDLELNKDAVIVLQGFGDTYKVISVSYLSLPGQ